MEQLLGKLGVNWNLLLAQVINFMLVLGVLSYFIYRPFLDLLDKRRARIQKAMDDAARIENQMQEFEVMKAEQQKKLDRESGEYLEAMRHKAQELQEEMVATATREAETIVQNAHKRAEEERRKMLDEVMKTVNMVVIRMTEKILEREFTEQDQKRIAESLQKELPSLLT